MAAFLPALIGAAGAMGAGWLSGRGSQGQTKLQKQQQKLIDQLLASLQGGGPYSSLFEMDENAFQKSFVDPMKSKFNNQIAPQIQQQFVSGGQQQGSGLQDTLTRAGVDLDQMLNQQYYNFQQDALNRKQNLLSNILGQQGTPYQPSSSQNIMAGLGGYLDSPDFAKQASSWYTQPMARRGFTGAQVGAAL